MTAIDALEPLIEWHDRLSEAFGFEFLAVRDDLLPFPLAGNKVRKLQAELQTACEGDLLLSNGGVDSNHCRTLAFFGARLGLRVHLVLHSEGDPSGFNLSLLTRLGASFEIVPSHGIRAALDAAEAEYASGGFNVRRISGGCHTPAGAVAYRDAGRRAIELSRPDVIVVASGTGATQGGLVAAAEGTGAEVIGISVARAEAPGRNAVAEAAVWAGCEAREINFVDQFRDGGYALHGRTTEIAVAKGWAFGFPLDPTYTGKAFAALCDRRFRAEHLAGKRVLFWHTGGLMNAITAPKPRPGLRKGW